MTISKLLKPLIAFVLFISAPLALNAETVIGFDITPEVFNQRFVNAAKAVGGHMPTNEPGKLVDSPYNSFYTWDYGTNYEFHGYVSNATGLMAGTRFIGKGDGTPESGGNILLLATATFMAANGDDTSKEYIEKHARTVLALLEKLQTRENQFMEVVVDDGRFAYSADQEMAAGTWFSIEASSGE